MWFSHDEAHIISLFFVFFLSLFSFFSKQKDRSAVLLPQQFRSAFLLSLYTLGGGGDKGASKI